MPELPEVEVVTQQIRPVLVGQMIKAVRIYFPKLRYPIELPPVGCQIMDVFRRNKYIIVRCQITQKGTESTFVDAIWHLGMSGQFRYFQEERPLEKHEHIELELDQGFLRYYDPRRFGALLLACDWQKHRLIEQLGVEPLEITIKDLASHWFNSAQKIKSQKPIKPFLMNGKYVVGIGNIYASEILWQAKIHPESIIQNLNMKDWQKIATHTQNILKQAIIAGGSTLHDFVDINGQVGEFQQSHFVYGRAQQTCASCMSLIQKITQEARSTFFCAKCQRLKK